MWYIAYKCGDNIVLVLIVIFSMAIQVDGEFGGHLYVEVHSHPSLRHYLSLFDVNDLQ